MSVMICVMVCGQVWVGVMEVSGLGVYRVRTPSDHLMRKMSSDEIFVIAVLIWYSWFNSRGQVVCSVVEMHSFPSHERVIWVVYLLIFAWMV